MSPSVLVIVARVLGKLFDLEYILNVYGKRKARRHAGRPSWGVRELRRARRAQGRRPGPGSRLPCFE